MTIEQVYWAMEHDWFYYASTRSTDGALLVTVYNDMGKGTLQFDNFNALYTWAGY